MIWYSIFMAIWGGIILWLILTFFKGESTYKVRSAFIDDRSLYPDAYRSLPSYETMSNHPRHAFRWTKAQWVKWVKDQGMSA